MTSMATIIYEKKHFQRAVYANYWPSKIAVNVNIDNKDELERNF